MVKIRIYGGSDDLIEVEGPAVDPANGMSDSAEYNNSESNAGPLDFKGTLLIMKRDRVPGCKVICLYDGTWSFAPAMIDEDSPIPPTWNFSVVQSTDCGYSLELVAEVDDGCYVTLQNGKEDEE